MSKHAGWGVMAGHRRWFKGFSQAQSEASVKKRNRRGVSETRKGMPTNIENEIKGEKNPPLDEDDMAFLCIKESDTCLVAPNQWDLVSDKQMMQEQPLQVAKMHKDN